MAISREDIEAKAFELVDAVESTKQSAKSIAVGGVIAVAVVVAAAFVIGRRRGARNKTVVEVYRV